MLFMSKKQKIKVKLDTLKTLIVVFMTALFGVFGYGVIHYKDLDLVLSIAVGVATVLLISTLCYLGMLFGKEFEKLEKK